MLKDEGSPSGKDFKNEHRPPTMFKEHRLRMSQLKVRFSHKAPGLTLGSPGGSALVEGCGNVRS